MEETTLAPKHYTELLTERELKEVVFCREYARHYAHGTTGHNAMMLVAKLSAYLDSHEGEWPVKVMLENRSLV